MAIVNLNIPIADNTIRSLHVGDQVRLSGVIVTARDAAHKYMKDTFFHGPIPEGEREVLRAGGEPGRCRHLAFCLCRPYDQHPRGAV
jgi:hypothetical protein